MEWSETLQKFINVAESLSEEADGACAIVAAATDTLILAANATRKFHLKSISVVNRAGGASIIQLWDGPSATGTLKLEFPVANNVYAELTGKNITFTKNTAIYVQASAAGAAPADVKVAIDGYWEDA